MKQQTTTFLRRRKTWTMKLGLARKLTKDQITRLCFIIIVICNNKFSNRKVKCWNWGKRHRSNQQKKCLIPRILSIQHLKIIKSHKYHASQTFNQRYTPFDTLKFPRKQLICNSYKPTAEKMQTSHITNQQTRKSFCTFVSNAYAIMFMTTNSTLIT